MKIAGCTLAILLLLPVGWALAQDQSAQSESVSPAEAARRAREQKQSQPKATKVFDNDTIPKTPGVINVVGQEPAETGESTAGENAPSGQAPAPGTAQASAPAAGAAASASSDASAAKARLQSLKSDLDTLKRTYDLDSQMYYSKPDYSTDKTGAQKLADEQARIDAKQQEIDDAQKQLDAAENQSKSSAPSSESGGSQPSETPQPSPTPPPS